MLIDAGGRFYGIVGENACHLQLIERCSAKCLLAAQRYLSSVSSAASAFKHRLRLCTTDRHSANTLCDIAREQSAARAALLGSRGGVGATGASGSAARGVRLARSAPAAGGDSRGLAAPAAGEPSPAVAPGIQALAMLLQKLSGADGDEDAGALASSADDYAHLGLRGGAGRLGAHQMERLHLSREARPSVVIESHQREIEKDLGVLAGEAWSYGRHARERVLPQAPGYHGLRKCIAILAHALDLHRTKGAITDMPSCARLTRPPRRPLATLRSSGPSGGLSWGSRTPTASRGQPSRPQRLRR